MRPQLRLDLPPSWRRTTPPDGVALQARHGEGNEIAQLAVTVTEPAAANPDAETLTRALEQFRLIDQGTVDHGTAAELAGQPCDWMLGRYLARDRHPATMTRWSTIVDGWRVGVTATIPSRHHDDLIDDVTRAVGALQVVATS